MIVYIIFTSFHPSSVVAYMFQFDILSHSDLYVSSKSFLASLLNVVVKDFDAMLDTHQHDDEVKKGIAEIMTAGNDKQGASSPVPIADIIQVHEFICKELQQTVEDYKKLENKGSYEEKTLTIAAQAIVASRVQKTYNYTPEQIEACVLANDEKLSQDAKFTALTVQIQQTMGQLIG